MADDAVEVGHVGQGRVPLSVEKGWRPPGGMLMDGVYSRSV
jgi:hypothetical protein